MGLADDNTLVRFQSDRPEKIERVRVTGVSGKLLGLDVRPADRHLYAVTSTYGIYRIDPTTGAAKLVSTLTVPFDGGMVSGVDFNPQSDRLRLVAGSGQNLRVHPDQGAAATDGALLYAPRDPNFGRKPGVSAAAYTQAVANAPTTKMFNIDSNLDLLVLQDPPNDGTLATVGALGFDFGPRTGFDIFTDRAGREHAFASSGSLLYAIDLETGAASRLGKIGDGSLTLLGLAVLGMTVAP